MNNDNHLLDMQKKQIERLTDEVDRLNRDVNIRDYIILGLGLLTPIILFFF